MTELGGDAAMRALVARLARLERQVATLGRSPQLGHSSIENRAVNVYDGSGQLQAVVGRQFDGSSGTVVVAGPAPPVPSAPTVETVTSGIRVTWDGGFVQAEADRVAGRPTVATLDWARCEIQVSESSAFPDGVTTKGGRYLGSAAGGNLFVPWAAGTPLYVRARSWSYAGKFSDWSPVTGPVAAGKVGLGDVGFDIGQFGGSKLFWQDTRPGGLTGDDKAFWWDSADDNRAHFWDGADWADVPVGNNAIQAGSLVASDVLATNSITSALLEALLVLATAILAGDQAGAHVLLSENGLQFFAVNPEGAIKQTGGFGTGADGITLYDSTTGEITVSLTGDSGGVMQSLSVSGVDADGDGLPETGFAVYGREYLDWLDDRAAGAVASAYTNNAASGVFASGITTTFGLGEVSFTAKAGRNYMVVFSGLHFGLIGGTGKALITVRGTIDGSTPTISNGTPYGSAFLHIPVADSAYTAPPIPIFGDFAASDVTVRLLVTAERFSGTGTLSALTYTGAERYNAPFRFFVLDAGRDIADTYIPNDGGGVRSGGNPSPTPKQNYQSIWYASFVGSYLGDGSRRTDTSDMVQGQTPYYTAGGNQKALAGFMGGATVGEVGKTVAAALSGATISKVEVGLCCRSSHYNSGGTGWIGYHGNTSLPATAPNATYGGFGGAHFDQGQTRWISLPSSTFPSWLNGTYRGFTVGPGPSTDPIYYVRFYGIGSNPKPGLRITYTR